MYIRSISSGPALQSAAILLGLSLAGWVGIFWSVANMGNGFVQLMMPMSATWSSAEIAAVFIMWSVMMGAMMLPSAMPMIMAHRRMSAQQTGGRHFAFAAAYLIVWSGFSALASALQWWFQDAELMTRMLVISNEIVASCLLIGAGVFQFTSLKEACLRSCRTPLGFLMTEWREGSTGAFVMGTIHGVYCVGCCAGTMLLLFVFGAMDIRVIAILSTIVALEKLTPWGASFAKFIGVVMIALGVAYSISHLS